MAEFTFDVSAPNSPLSPMSPVQDNSAAIGWNGISDTISNIGGFVENKFRNDDAAEKVLKADRAAALELSNKAEVGEFAQRQIALADAVESGGMGSAEARARMRANLTSAISNNPALAMDLGKAHSTLVKNTGLAQAAYDGTTAEKQALALENKALESGWITPQMTPQEKQAGTSAFMDLQRSKEVMEYNSKKIGLQSAQVGLTTAGINQQNARLTLQNNQHKQESQVAVGQASNAYMVKLSNDLEAIRRKKESGEIDATTAVMAADQAYLAVDQVTRQVGAAAGGEYVQNVVAPMKIQLDNYKKYMSGEIQLNDLNSRNDTTTAMQTANLLGNPRAAKLVAASKLFPNSQALTMSKANEEVMRFVESGSDTETKPADVMPDYKEGKEGLSTYFSMMGETMGKVNMGVAVDPEETSIQVNKNMTNILRSVDVYGPSVASPTDFNAVMDFLSKPETGKFITKQGGFTDQASAYKAAQTLEYEYANKVLPLIQEEYKKAVTGGHLGSDTSKGAFSLPITGEQPAQDLIVPTFLGGGITFTTRPGVDNWLAQRKAKELNKSVAPTLNRLIRTTAHLEGTMDYKSIYDSKFASLFALPEKGKVDVTGQ